MNSRARCACCGYEFDPRDDGDEFWEGRMDDYCSPCSLTRCDWRAGACGRPAPSVDSVAPKSGTGATANRPAPGQQEGTS